MENKERSYMKKVILYIGMSLDGFIADKDMEVNWMNGDGSDIQEIGSYDQFIKNIDTVIMGYTTYYQIVNQLAKDNWPYKGMITYVLTHKHLLNQDEIIFTDEKIITIIQRLKKRSGKNIWICGGANIVNQLIELNLIDEYHITIIPTILGAGVRLFKDNNSEIKLKLVKKDCYNGMVEICYQKR